MSPSSFMKASNGESAESLITVSGFENASYGGSAHVSEMAEADEA
jgi:hypothetical protein